MALAALDQGTTSTRALRLEADGTSRVVFSRRHGQHHPAPGRVEHDPEELIAALTAALDALGPVDAIAIANQGESCLAWDAHTGRAVTPVIVWQDDRTAPLIDRLKQEGADALVTGKTGLPLDAYFSASKLGWIMANVPEARALHAKGRLRLGTTDAFFLHRLTGRCVSDVTTASRTSLMALDGLAWDAELCALFGVPIEALPEIVPTTGDFGAVRCGGRMVPVTASLTDQQAALYGHGCHTPGAAKITVGTGAFLLMVTGPRVPGRAGGAVLPTVAWQKAGEAAVFALDGGVHSAGAAVEWARGLGLFDDLAALEHFDASPALARGLAFVPALSGLACPHWDRAARGVWLGLSLETGRADLMQAVLEGIAFRAAEVLDAMAAHTAPAGAISMDGGLSNNRYFVQMTANAFGQPIRLPATAELTAAGAARLAADAIGQAIAWPQDGRTVAPDADVSGLRARFAEAVAASRAWKPGGP